MHRDPRKVYTTHGTKPQLLGAKVLIDNVLCIAYMKDGKILSYEPWEDFQRQMLMGPCFKVNTTKA